jgi:hypothetical protein
MSVPNDLTQAIARDPIGRIELNCPAAQLLGFLDSVVV